MDNQSKGLTKKHLVYLVLASVFAILSIQIGRQFVYIIPRSQFIARFDLRSIFWLTSFLAACMLVPLIKLILEGMHDRHWLPKSLDYFYGEEFHKNLEKRSLVLKLRLRTLTGKLVLMGSAILFIVAFVCNISIIRTFEPNTFLSETLRQFFVKQREPRTKSIVRELSLYTASNDMSQYFENCAKIVNDLGRIGAKVVMVNIPNSLTSRAGSEYKQIEELARTGMVIFSAPDSYVLQGLTLPRGIPTIEPDAVPYSPMLCRVRPAGEATWYHGGTLDITLELLRRFRGYPDSLLPTLGGSILTFGAYKIPVTKDGWMYSRDFGDYRSWTPVLVTRGFRSDTLQYSVDLHTNPEYFQGNIVILRWDNRGNQSSFRDHSYASVLQNIIDNDIMRKFDASPLWLTVICLLVVGFIANRFRPLASVLLIFLFGVIVLVLNSFLYNRMNLFVEMMYPLLSILMAMVIFPAMSFIHHLDES